MRNVYTKQIKINRQKAWRLKVALENGMFDMFHQCPKCDSRNISDYMDEDVYKVRRLNQKPHWHYVCFDCGTEDTIYYCTTYIKADTPFHQALHAHFEHEMPYNMATGDVGDPDEWIENQLEDLGFFDKPITGGY